MAEAISIAFGGEGASMLMCDGIGDAQGFEHVDSGGIDLVEVEVDRVEAGLGMDTLEDANGVIGEDAALDVQDLKCGEVFA